MMVDPLVKVVDLRLVVEVAVPVEGLITDMGGLLHGVVAGVELKADGFGHILPDPNTAQFFVGQPQKQEAAVMLATGEVK